MSVEFMKFRAPGTGDVIVLSINLTHDPSTDMKEGVVRLEKRPYWEGGATPFTLEMPAMGEREAMRLTGLWVARGDFDGEGCNITVTNVKSLPLDVPLLEVNGKVYPLTRVSARDNEQTYTASGGERYTMRIGRPRMEVTTPDVTAQNLGAGGPQPCRVTMNGAVHTGLVWVNGWSHSDQEVYLTIEDFVKVPVVAAPDLDESTDPADLDWGALRSAADRRDWREAWDIVGTDHVGAASPGEVYLLSVARHKSATAAALKAWCNVAMLRSVARSRAP